MLALEEVGSSLTRVKKWGDGLVGGATMHTTALYLKTNSFTNSIVVVFLLVFLVNFTIGIPSAARQEHGGGDFQAMRQRVQKIGTWRSENRTCCVAGAGREWKILVFGSKNQTQILKSRIFCCKDWLLESAPY